MRQIQYLLESIITPVSEKRDHFMLLNLPRPNPLYENIPTSSIHLPDTLKKMGSGGFTGYLGYGSANAEGYLVFIRGALISTLLLEGSRRKTGFDAINALFLHLRSEAGMLNVYRMTAEVAMCTQALLHGTTILQEEPVAAIDLKGLLGRMKEQALNGTVLFRTAERSGMIFYQEGAPVGFYHDGAREVLLTPNETQKVAALPGAVVEVYSTPPVEELVHHNFLETLNLERLWQAGQPRTNNSQPQQPAPAAPPPAATADIAPQEQQAPAVQQTDQLPELVEDLQEIAKAYLGRAGATLLDSLLENNGGHTVLLQPEKTTGILADLASQSLQLDPDARVDEMVELMHSEIAARLAF